MSEAINSAWVDMPPEKFSQFAALLRVSWEAIVTPPPPCHVLDKRTNAEGDSTRKDDKTKVAPNHS